MKSTPDCPERAEVIFQTFGQLSLLDVMESTKEGLMALAVQTGLRVIQVMMQEKVEVLVGPKGKHHPERKAVRHGKEKGRGEVPCFQQPVRSVPMGNGNWRGRTTIPSLSNVRRVPMRLEAMKSKPR